MIIFGLKGYADLVATLTMLCPRCHNPAAHRLHKLRRKFSLFFVPLFVVSTRYVMDCTFCGLQHAYSKAEGSELEERFAAGPQAPAPAPVPPLPPAAHQRADYPASPPPAG
ncbi:zinc-ribbon domain-containing protein [Oceanitalea stevensii]|uniref:Zinc-ribbon domain-containing protein n=1 Tax=Oceanitalea stevensii TaxID=2763072 RepID=A0ABR8YZB3_9MICO|nr:zinc-ribbon domain-containing protein [Oceanitalea stevensii]MBD8061380.1 zinc-ribbon domain-containing protein [Oceanitalea stevensii]